MDEKPGAEPILTNSFAIELGMMRRKSRIQTKTNSNMGSHAIVIGVL